MSPHPHDVLVQSQLVSVPPSSKASLKAWWKQFTSAQKKKEAAAAAAASQEKENQRRVFGAPLRESLHYASVQISTANANGELYVWGYIPVVVAKCGLYLKEKATETQGIFRVSGSAKRMRDLQAIFEAPPKYGKNLDWKNENFTTHDVASVFRRYLTQMPEPVIPFNMYDKFRDVIVKKRSVDDTIKAYQQIIRSMPRANQYLLLYVLDLLSVFARKADKNLMTATNLAVIFRPGVLSHPNHELSPKEHQPGREVLEFLIEHQDWFMLDIPPPPTSSSRSGTNVATRQDSIVPSSPLSPGSPVSDEDHDVIIVPSSDEDGRETEGGWKLVERARKVDRRRTMGGRQRAGSGPSSPTDNRPVIYGLPAVSETSPTIPQSHEQSYSRAQGQGQGYGQDEVVNAGGAVTVTRSRTMPSKRTPQRDRDREAPGSGRGGQPQEERHQANVLRKQKRVTMQPPRSKAVLGPASNS